MSFTKKLSKGLLNLKAWIQLHLTTPSENREIVGLVFSKDRPMQLYALLESYFQYCEDPRLLHILYRASDEKFTQAYQEVVQAFIGKPVKFHSEMSFRDDLLNIIASLEEKYLFFLVDDNVFKASFSFSDFLSLPQRDSYLFSMRLGSHITYSYTNQVSQPVPKLFPNGKFLSWRLSNTKTDWNYAFSVDGNIYLKDEILIMSRLIAFKAPNSYEARMNVFRYIFRSRHGVCYPESRVINICLNRVQEEVQNIAGDYSVEELLELWNKGMKMDVDAFYEIKNQSAHVEVDPIPLKERT